MRVVGIDYSITSPCVCIGDRDNFSLDTCQFYFLTDHKKLDIDVDNIRGDLHRDHNCEEQRYGNITAWVMGLLEEDDKVYMEGYSMGSTGRVFNIAENCGLLKHYLWKWKYDFTVIPPTVIKKFATGKGNANKQLLQECFIKETGYDVKAKLNLTEKQWNPSSDIIDAYYICKLGTTMELTDV